MNEKYLLVFGFVDFYMLLEFCVFELIESWCNKRLWSKILKLGKWFFDNLFLCFVIVECIEILVCYFFVDDFKFYWIYFLSFVNKWF